MWRIALCFLFLSSQLVSAANGFALYRAHRLPAAEKALRAALLRNANDWESRLYLARTLVALKRPAEALPHLRRLAQYPDNPDARFQAGKVLQELAARRLATLSEIAPGSFETLELEGNRLELSGNLAEALVRYRAAAALESKRPGIHYAIGNVLWRQRELVSAERELAAELALNPHHGQAQLRLGQVLFAADRAGEAVAPLSSAVADLGGSVEARRELGKALRKTGRLAEAIAQWEDVAVARPNDDQVHFLLGAAYKEAGRAEDAQRSFAAHRRILQTRRTTSQP